MPQDGNLIIRPNAVMEAAQVIIISSILTIHTYIYIVMYYIFGNFIYKSKGFIIFLDMLRWGMAKIF